MKKIEHIGIAVKDLAAAEKIYTTLMGAPPYKRETIASQKVITSFFRSGPNKIELLQATDEESPIAKFIAKKGEGMHHIAYDVSNIQMELDRLRKEGFRLIHETPIEGADNKLIAFLHPKSANGVLIELCQDRPSQ